MSANILELDRVTKRFGATVAADALSLTVQKGEFFTFLGPSGSGKSTVLRMVAGLEEPDGGTIRIDGQDVAAVSPWHRNLGMMFQNYAVFPHMNVRMNVGYGLKARRLPSSEVKKRVDAMLELVGLAQPRRQERDVALGRRAAAGGAGARAGARTENAAARRAAVSARRENPPCHASRAEARASKNRHDFSLCHSRPGGGAHAQRPYCRDQSRAMRPVRRARAPVQAAATAVRGGVLCGCNVLEAELAGQGDGAATYRLAGIGIDVPLGDIETRPARGAARRKRAPRRVRAATTVPAVGDPARHDVPRHSARLPAGAARRADAHRHHDTTPGGRAGDIRTRVFATVRVALED